MIKGATEQASTRVTGLVYKEEGDTRERCGPLYKRLSDGSLQNFMDAQSEPKLREDGTLFAAWFRLSQVRRYAKQEKLSAGDDLMKRRVFASQVFRAIGAAFWACPVSGGVPQFMDHPPSEIEVAGFEFCGEPVSEALARRVLREGYDGPDCLAAVSTSGSRHPFAYTP